MVVTAVADRQQTALDVEARRNDAFVAFSAALVGLYPAAWLIGLAPGFWVVLGVTGAVHLARVRWSAATAAPLVIGAALLLSSPVGMIRFGGDPGRLVSLLANVLTWVAVAALLTAVAARPGAAAALAKPLVLLGAVQGALIAASAAIYPAKLPVPLLEPLFAHAPIGVRTFATNGLYYADWLGEEAFRSQGIMGNATWNGAIGAVTVLVAVGSWRAWRGRWRVLAVAGVVGGLVSVQTSLSRATLIALVLAGLAGVWIVLRRRTALVWWAVTAALVLAAVVVLGVLSHPVLQAVSDLNSERAGSLETRSDIYRATLAAIAEHPFPLLGYGIKPQEDGLVASVATHSTYLGIVFRAGWLGAAALAALLVGGLVRSFREGDALGFALVGFTAVWCLFEDLDGGHLLPVVLAFAYCAVGSGRADLTAVPLSTGREFRVGRSRPSASRS